MHWLSFFIGALIGWLVCWLIDYLFCRPRRIAAEQALRDQLQRCNEECTSLKAQLGSTQDLQARLSSSGAEMDTLKAQFAGTKDLQVRLDGANAELGTLKAQLAGMKDLQVRLDGANAELAAFKAKLSEAKEVQPTEAGDLQVQLQEAHAEIDGLKARLSEAQGLPAQVDGAQAELQALKAKLSHVEDLEGNLAFWQTRSSQQGLEIERLRTQLSSGARAALGGVVGACLATAAMGLPAAPATDAGIVAAPLTTAVPQPDDLILIEGIGPKINELLNKAGIVSFAQLAATSLQRLNQILDAAGPRFRLADPQTWPEQAALARDGKWEAFQALQGTLKAGRRD